MAKLIKKLLRKFKYYARYPLQSFKDLERYIAYRTYDNYRVVKADLPAGFYEPGDLLLPISFALLKKFVEVNLAYQALWSHEDKAPKWLKISEYLPSPLSDIITPDLVSRELGMLALEDQIESIQKDNMYSPQHREEHLHTWKEIKELYIWWTDLRPKRGEPGDVSGFYEICETLRIKNGNVHKFIPIAGSTCKSMQFSGSAADYKAYSDASDRMWEEEKRQNKEDEEMLIRLVKIKEHLWS